MISLSSHSVATDLATVHPPLATRRYFHWPPSVAPRPAPRAENWVRFSWSIPPSFVLSHNMPMINTTSNWLCSGAFLSPSCMSLQFYWPLATVLVSLVTLLTLHDRRGQHATKCYVLGFLQKFGELGFRHK